MTQITCCFEKLDMKLLILKLAMTMTYNCAEAVEILNSLKKG